MLYAIASEDEMLGEYAKVFWDYIKDDVISNFRYLARNKRRIGKRDLLAIFEKAIVHEAYEISIVKIDEGE